MSGIDSISKEDAYNPKIKSSASKCSSFYVMNKLKQRFNLNDFSGDNQILKEGYASPLSSRIF